MRRKKTLRWLLLLTLLVGGLAIGSSVYDVGFNQAVYAAKVTPGDAVDAANAQDGTMTADEQTALQDGLSNGSIIQNDDGTYSLKGKISKSGLGTIIAGTVMDTDGASQMQKGAVQADVPYSSFGNSAAGKQVRSYLVTMSHYNYWQTNTAKDALTGKADGVLTKIVRGVGGLLGFVSLAIESVTDKFRDVIATAFMKMPVVSALGIGSNSVDQSSPITQAMNTFYNALGLNSQFLKMLVTVGMLFATTALVFVIMYRLGKNGKVTEALSEPVKRWFTRIFVIFVMLPLEGVILGALMVLMAQGSEVTGGNSTVAQYLVNTRTWAAASNLAPDGGAGRGQVPNGDPDAQPAYLDTGYLPSKSRAFIHSVNQHSYELYQGQQAASDWNMGIDLLSRWTEGETYNVNDYVADVREAGHSSYAYKGFTKADGRHWSSLNKYVWGAEQNVSGDDRYAETFVNNSNISPNNGVFNGSLSTQSVALLTSSGLDDSKISYYSYNVAPSGIYSANPLPTVKPTWYSVSLVGSSGLGQFGSYLEMIVNMLVTAVLTVFIALALMRVGLIDSLMRQWKDLVSAIGGGNLGAAIGQFILAIGVIFTGALSLNLAEILVKLMTSFTTIIVNGLTGGDIDGLSELMSSFTMIVMTIFLVWNKKGSKGDTPIYALVSLPMAYAKELEEHIRQVLGRSRGMMMRDSRSLAAVAGQFGTDLNYESGNLNYGAGYTGDSKNPILNGRVLGADKLLPDGNETSDDNKGGREIPLPTDGSNDVTTGTAPTVGANDFVTGTTPMANQKNAEQNNVTTTEWREAATNELLKTETGSKPTPGNIAGFKYLSSDATTGLLIHWYERQQVQEAHYTGKGKNRRLTGYTTRMPDDKELGIGGNGEPKSSKKLDRQETIAPVVPDPDAKSKDNLLNNSAGEADKDLKDNPSEKPDNPLGVPAINPVNAPKEQPTELQGNEKTGNPADKPLEVPNGQPTDFSNGQHKSEAPTKSFKKMSDDELEKTDEFKKASQQQKRQDVKEKLKKAVTVPNRNGEDKPRQNILSQAFRDELDRSKPGRTVAKSVDIVKNAVTSKLDGSAAQAKKNKQEAFNNKIREQLRNKKD